MNIVKKFEYEQLTRIDHPLGRRYAVSTGAAYPSVTTILSKTKDNTHLNDWILRVGVVEAERIKVEASDIGTAMHQNLENYVLGLPMVGKLLPRTLAGVIAKNGLSKITEVWGAEVQLYSPGLYAGTTDLVGMFNGTPAIIDFKNSIREKRKEWIEDYRAQLAAYALAHNELYGTDISTLVVMIATRDAKYQEFVFSGKEYDESVDMWLGRLSAYYEKYPT